MPTDETLWTDPKGYANTMVPIDVSQGLDELVRIALFNIDRFDKVARLDEPDEDTRKIVAVYTYRQKFEDGLARIAMRQGWSPEQCAQVAILKNKRPPDRLYRVRGGFHSATRGLSPLGIIVTYRPGGGGGPAEAGVAVLGFSKDMIGSAARPMGIPAEGLEDVTEAARRGTLPELRGDRL